MDSSATLNVAIGNLLTITTSATLSGTLNLSGSGTDGEDLINLPSNYSGTFTTVNVPAGYGISYTSDEVELVVRGAAELGRHLRGRQLERQLELEQ